MRLQVLLAICAIGSWDYEDEEDELGEDEIGTVPEDLSEY